MKTKTMTMTTLHLRKSVDCSPLRCGFLLLPVVLACFALLPPKAFGVLPAPDGGYANDNMAEVTNALGSLTTGSNNIDIGNPGVTAESNTIRVGEEGKQTGTFIAGIHGQTVTGSALFINSAGRLGTVPSSQRFKDNITPMDKLSEGLFALEPVAFHYKKELDPVGGSQFGLVAEQVVKVNPDLVVRDKKENLTACATTK